MSEASTTIRVFIPLAFRKKNGRPRILPPAEIAPVEERSQDPHVLRAVARAWSWRRQLESGAASTLQDIAAAEKLSHRFVGRMIRLAYLSPGVLERLVAHRVPPALSLKQLITLAERPWLEQETAVTGYLGSQR